MNCPYFAVAEIRRWSGAVARGTIWIGNNNAAIITMSFYLKSDCFEHLRRSGLLLGCLALSSLWTISAEAQIGDPGMISLPDDPAAVVVPPTRAPAQQIDQQMEKKREAREKRDEKFKKPPKDPAKERNAKLLNDMVTPRPNQFFLAANLVYPLAQVTGPREEYVFEPSVVISSFLRIGEVKVYSDYVIWTGARIATFAGTGTYDGIPGRFGFSYFGPMIGVGKIDPAPLSIPREATKADVDPGKFLSSRSAIFFVAGIAAQSRFAETFAGAETPKEDLNNAAAGFDPPGLWGEAHYSWIHFGAVSINFLAGIQLGSGKTMAYFGGGFGGIY